MTDILTFSKMENIYSHYFGDFDILFRDMFNNSENWFTSISSKAFKPNYPSSIRKSDKGIEIDIVAVGVDKKDIEIEIDKNILEVKYQKKQENTKDYIYNSICKKNFDFQWQISNDLDLNKIDVSLDKGLLNIKIPFSEKKLIEKKKIEIK